MLRTSHHALAPFGLKVKMTVCKTPVCHHREGSNKIQGAAIPPGAATSPDTDPDCLNAFILQELSLQLQASLDLQSKIEAVIRSLCKFTQIRVC